MTTKALPKLPLLKFCDPENSEGSRFRLDLPWQGKYTYATNARIAVRVDHSCYDGELLPDDCRRPDVDSVLAGIANVKEWKPLPEFPACELCGGEGNISAACSSCDGDGFTWCSRCRDDHTCQCCEGSGEFGSTCEACPVSFGPKWVWRHLANKLKLLPNVQWGAEDDAPDKVIYFQFTGGVGAVMPFTREA